MLPSPGNYRIKGNFGKADDTQLGLASPSTSRYFTFGTGRCNMAPMHVDKVRMLAKKN